MKKFIVFILFLSPLILSAQYNVHLKSGVDFFSQNSFEDRIAYTFTTGISRQTKIGEVGAFYRVNRNSLFHGSGATFLADSERVKVYIDERGPLNSHEISIQYFLEKRNLIINPTFGLVFTKLESVSSYAEILNIERDILKELIFNKSYRRDYFFRVGFGLGYEIKLNERVSLVPSVDFLYDIKEFRRIWHLESVEDFDSDYKQEEDYILFNAEEKLLNHESKYLYFNLGVKYSIL